MGIGWMPFIVEMGRAEAGKGGGVNAIATDLVIAKPARSIASAVQLARVPLAMTEVPRWVGWRYEWREGKNGNPGKWTKVPVRAFDTRYNASSINARTWTDYTTALSAYLEDQSLAGVGFVLGDGFCGVDLDDCVVDGKLLAYAAKIVADFNTYTEYSPSGTGVKLFLRGNPLPAEKDGGWRKSIMPGRGDIEMYSESRFFTVTGRALEAKSCE